ncbi:Crp/Fnr family transcriptional regulator [Flavobacteriaceae bacterium M23B6Z8]
MPSSSFKNFVENYTLLSEEVWRYVSEVAEPISYRKGDLILKEGDICRHLYFIENGLLRFFVWKDGNDITKFFTIAPYFFTSQRSFTKQQPAKENIEAIEDSDLWRISYQDNEELLQLPSWSRFARKITEEVQYFTERILEDLQNETAERRYQKMAESQNELLQRVPQKYIASFLGVTPQSLSRIRKNIL